MLSSQYQLVVQGEGITKKLIPASRNSEFFFVIFLANIPLTWNRFYRAHSRQAGLRHDY